MSMIDIDPTTYTVPENNFLLYLDGSDLKKKDHAGTIGSATEGDLFYLGITSSDLPCLVEVADYDTAHAKGEVPPNIDKSVAIGQSAAAKISQNVSDQKVNNVKFTTFKGVINQTVDTHIANGDVHVTASDKSSWNTKPTKAEVTDAINELNYSSFKVFASNTKINNGKVSALSKAQRNLLISAYGDWVKTVYAITCNSVKYEASNAGDPIIIGTDTYYPWLNVTTVDDVTTRTTVYTKEREYAQFQAGVNAVYSNTGTAAAPVMTNIGTISEIEDVTLYVQITASKSEAFYLKFSGHNRDLSKVDTVIDWGDGTRTLIKNGADCIVKSLTHNNITYVRDTVKSTIIVSGESYYPWTTTVGDSTVYVMNITPASADVLYSNTGTEAAPVMTKLGVIALTTAEGTGYYTGTFFTNDNETGVTVLHTYAAEGVYHVKIYGKDYFSYTHYLRADRSNGVFQNSSTSTNFSLVCEALSDHCRIASHITSATNMYAFCRKLLKVQAYYANPLARISNATGMFMSSTNLFTASVPVPITTSVRQMFSACSNLTYADINGIPVETYSSGTAQIFNACRALKLNINDLIYEPLNVKVADVKQLFAGNAAMLTETLDTDASGNLIKVPVRVPSEYLWEDTSVTWVNTASAFASANSGKDVVPAAIRAQVPTSWGGTNTEIEAKLQAGYWNNLKKHEVDDSYLRIDGTNAMNGSLTLSEKLTPPLGPKDKPMHTLKLKANAMDHGRVDFDFTTYDLSGNPTTVTTFLELGASADWILLKSTADATYAVKTDTESHINNTDIHVTAADKTTWNAKATTTDVATAKSEAIAAAAATALQIDGSNAMTAPLVVRSNGGSMGGGRAMKIDASVGTEASENFLKFGYFDGVFDVYSTLAVDGSEVLTKNLADTYYAATGDLTTHTGNTDIHVTLAEKNKWNNLVSVMRWKGSCTWAELQAKTGMEVGDTWCVTDKNNTEYAWAAPSGTETTGHWEQFGTNVDMTLYALVTDVATAKSEAIAAAATDASTKADAAQAAAEATAAADATSKANSAETNAKSYADSISHTHDNKTTLDSLSLSGRKLFANNVLVEAKPAGDDSCVQLSDLDTVFGRNNIAGGFPLEVVGYNVLGEHRYAWYNGTTTIYTTKVDTSSYTQFYAATGTTVVAGKGKGVKDSTIVEPNMYAWTATGNYTTGTIAYAYRNASSGNIYYANTASASTSTNLFSDYQMKGTAVKPTAASGTPRAVTIDGTVYTYASAYNKVTVFTESAQPTKTDASGNAVSYYTNTNITSGTSLNVATTTIAADFSSITLSNNQVFSRDTTMDYTGRGSFNRDASKDYAGSSIIRVVPIGGGMRSDDRYKSIYYKNASGVWTDLNSSLVTYMKKGVFGFVCNSSASDAAYCSYAFRNADSGKIYYTNTKTPTNSTAMYPDSGLTGTSVKPTAYTTTSPRTITISGVVYTYDANFTQFTTSKLINCTKDLWTLIDKALSLGSAAYVRLYQLDAPSKAAWKPLVQNWWVGTCLYNTSYSTFYNCAAAENGQPKDSSGQWKLYYKLGETEQYVLMSSAPSADNSNKIRPTEQQAWFDIYSQVGGIIMTGDEMKTAGLKFADGTPLKCIAEAIVPDSNGDFQNVLKSDDTVVLTAAQCATGIWMKEDNNLRLVTKYDQKEIFELSLFESGKIYIHPTMSSSYGLTSLKFTFDSANVVPEFEQVIYDDNSGEGPSMIGATLLLNSDIIDPNNIDTILTLDPGSMSDPAMAALPSPKRGYTSFVDGEYNAGLGYNCMVTGNSNEVYGDWAVCSGLHNLVAGMMTVATGNNNIVFGDGGHATGGANQIFGADNFGTGVANMMRGYDSVAVGARNQTFGVSDLAVGFSNEVFACRCITVGTRNRAYEKGNDSILIGMNLKNYAAKAMVLGAYGVVNQIEGVRPDDTSTTVQMPVYGLPVQLTSANISTYVGQTLYLTNSTLPNGTYTSTKITNSHVGRWIILQNTANVTYADTKGIDNKNGYFFCMGDYEKDDSEALAVCTYTKYRWSVNNAYFAATPGTTGRTGLDPYICEPFHQWTFTGVMSMKFTEATAKDAKFESWEVETRDGGRVKTFDPGKEHNDASAAQMYLDFNQATRWKVKEGTNLVLFPRNFVDGAEAYVVIYAGKTVSWTGFTNGADSGVGANKFDSLVWKGGSAPVTETYDTGFVLVKLMVVDNVCIAETIANTLAVNS